MHKPGEIVYARPGFAVMCVGEDEYIFGEKIKKVNAEVLIKALDLDLPLLASIGYVYGQEAMEGRAKFDILEQLECLGYALAMAEADTLDKYFAAWGATQTNQESLFRLHPMIDGMSAAAAEGFAEFKKAAKSKRKQMLSVLAALSKQGV